MEEKYQEYKKSKEYKKHILINVFLGFLFVLIIASIVGLYYLYNGNKKEVIANKNYFYEIKENIVYLNSSDGLESTYKCKEKCEIYTRGAFKGYFNKGRILLQEGVNIYLYDLLNNKKLSSNYSWIDYIYDESGEELDNIKMFKVKDSFNKHGIMDLNGNILVGLTFDELGKIVDNSLVNYSYENNYITAKSGLKWGLISLTNGKGLIDYQYEDIKISSYNKLAVKESNLWTLVDGYNKKLINKGYSSIDIYEKYMVVSEGKKAFVLDTLGNVTSNKIDLYYDVDPWATITVKGLSTKLEEGVINLYVDVPVDQKAGTYKTIKYFYEEENNEIKSAE